MLNFYIPLLFLSLLGQGSSKCQNVTVIRLTDTHNVIQTPGFPNRYPIPLCMHWIIDSQLPYIKTDPYSNGKRIRVYLTQVYLQENLTFVQYVKYPSPSGHDVGVNVPIDRNEMNEVRRKSKSMDYGYNAKPIAGIIKKETDPAVIGYATSLRYFGIQVEVTTPFAAHFRARNFLHFYGFNITYEIVDENYHLEDFGKSGECTLRNCSSAGHCYVASDYRRFFCDCLLGRYGQYCEYNSDQCNPKQNITFCRNGGACKMQASGIGICLCPSGYTGQLCQRKVETSVKECPGPECRAVCDRLSQSVHRPCSCHNGRTLPPRGGWMRYEVMLQALVTIPEHDFRSHVDSPTVMKLKTDIENSLREKLSRVPGFGEVDTSLSIVSFGPASKIFFQFFGPIEAVNNSTLKDVLLNGSLPPLRELSQTFKFNSYPALTLRKVVRGRPNETLKVGDAFDLTCEAEGSRSVTFKWFKEGVPINPSLAMREIYEKKHQSMNSFVSTSILMFSTSTIVDAGVFTCQVSDMGEEQCMDVPIELVAPPSVEVEPMSLTLDKGEKDRILLCSSEYESARHNFSYSWERNGSFILNRGHGTNEVIEDLDPYGSLLRILEAEASVKYTCIVRNIGGQNYSSVEVRVLHSQYLTFCRHELDEQNHVTWNRTAVGQIAKRGCPSGFVGSAQRSCYNSTRHGKPRWGPSDFSNCISRELRDLSKNVQTLKMGFANNTHIFGLMQRLLDHLESKKFVYTGEGERIIAVLQDIGNYAIQKQDVIDKTDDKFLLNFLNATTQLLKFSGSCSHEQSAIRLSNLIHEVATKFPALQNPFVWNSNEFVLEKLRIASSPFSHAIRFPTQLTQVKWADIHLEIPTVANGNMSNDKTMLVFLVFRNLTSIISPNPSLATFPSPLRLESPIISVTTPNFTMSGSSYLHLSFNISSTLALQIQKNERNVSCGGMEPSDIGGKISWTENACTNYGLTNNITFECFCEHFGQFGLRGFEIKKKSGPVKIEIHWSVILGTVVLILGCGVTIICILIHIEFQFSPDSLYSLKLIASSTLIFSHLFILSLRTEAYSIPLSTTLCTLLILSLSCQLTKPLTVLVSDQIELYPCLRSLSTLTILFVFFIAFSIPLWTAAAALSHSRPHAFTPASSTFEGLKYMSVLSEDSSVFGVFVIVISFIVLGFLIFSFKAFSHLRSVRLKVDAVKNHAVNYRLKIINRAIIITAITILLILTGVMYINTQKVLIYQYLFGLASFATGITIFLSYTIKSEYPIPRRFIHCLSINQFQDYPDPAKYLVTLRQEDERSVSRRTSEKVFENGHVSAILLPNNQTEPHRERTTTFDSINSGQFSQADTTIETIGGSSISTSSGRRDSLVIRTSSISTQKRTSTASTLMTRSMTNPGNSTASSCRPLLNQTQPCTGCCRKNRTRRAYSCGGSCAPIKPDRGRCLLREIAAADYVLPSKSTSSNTYETVTLAASASAKARVVVPSSLATSDICPGYIDVESPSGNEKGTPAVSTFQPKYLQPPVGRGTEELYESIPSRSSSVNEMTSSATFPAAIGNKTSSKKPLTWEDFCRQRRPLPSSSVPLVYNGGMQGPIKFRMTNPLPPTPTELGGPRQLLNQSTHVTKSDPSVQANFSRDLDYLLERPPKNFRSQPIHTGIQNSRVFSQDSSSLKTLK